MDWKQNALEVHIAAAPNAFEDKTFLARPLSNTDSCPQS